MHTVSSWELAFPGNWLLMNSDSGKIVTSYPAAAMVDDMAYDSGSKRIYFAGTNSSMCSIKKMRISTTASDTFQRRFGQKRVSWSPN